MTGNLLPQVKDYTQTDVGSSKINEFDERNDYH